MDRQIQSTSSKQQSTLYSNSPMRQVLFMNTKQLLKRNVSRQKIPPKKKRNTSKKRKTSNYIEKSKSKTKPASRSKFNNKKAFKKEKVKVVRLFLRKQGSKPGKLFRKKKIEVNDEKASRIRGEGRQPSRLRNDSRKQIIAKQQDENRQCQYYGQYNGAPNYNNRQGKQCFEDREFQRRNPQSLNKPDVRMDISRKRKSRKKGKKKQSRSTQKVFHCKKGKKPKRLFKQLAKKSEKVIDGECIGKLLEKMKRMKEKKKKRAEPVSQSK